MARKRYRRSGNTDGGASWISYSDMMAALLLVFVLVLCYSVYQYFLMLETKTAELDEKGAQLTTQQTQLDAQRATLDAQQITLSAQQATLDAQTATLTEQQAELLKKQNELNGALTAIEEQKGLLTDQSLTIEEKERIIIEAQAALNAKETELAAAQAELEKSQNELADATILLGAQREAMDNQAQRLDDLVGVRTKIIRELSSALSSASLRAKVDANTGDIMLESAVFFDVGKNTIKESGQELLNAFIPVYLGVLLRDEYADFLGEIIIEGHTDTQGTYLMNLELSQERALSVATYCLGMPGLSEKQLELLRGILTAKGRSYSDPIYSANGRIDMDASRRVEFKFRLKDAEMIDELRTILENNQQTETAAPGADG